MKLGVIALDYDGTTAQHDRLDPAARDAIADARTRGITVLIVTGRSLDELRRVAGDLHFVDVVVAENGAVLHFPGNDYTTVLAAYETAKQKGLGVAAGTQRRHHAAYIEAMKRVHDGAIGEIVASRAYWNQGGLWSKPRQAGWTDVEYQLRNWLYYTWLSGDHIVEQHVHNLDVSNWGLGAIPVRVFGVGGRQARTAPEYGYIYDHFGLDFEYPNGVHMLSMCRQQPGTPGLVAETLVGTKGTLETQDGRRYEITGPSAWKWTGEYTNPYQQEHTDLIASIRAGKPINELKQVAGSTLTAIVGREAAYTGKVLVFDEYVKTGEDLMPDQIAFGPMPVPPVAVPGTAGTM